MKVRKIVSITGLVFLTLLLSLYLYFQFNFHAVIPNQIYRSHQLTKSGFEAVIKDKNIKTIINLRGASPNQFWYQQELAASKATGVKHYDLSLRSNILPNVKQMKELVHLLETAPRPILLHCKGGADRTGLASEISLILSNDKNLEQISKQASWRYFVFNKESVGKQFLPIYEKYLKNNKLQSSKANFIKWLDQVKSGPNYPTKLYLASLHQK